MSISSTLSYCRFVNFFFLTESFSFSEVPFLFFKRLFKITFPFGPRFVDAGPSITLRISVGESFLSVSPSLCVCVCPSLCLSALSLFPPNFFPLFEPLQLRGLPQSLVIPACLLIVGGGGHQGPTGRHARVGAAGPLCGSRGGRSGMGGVLPHQEPPAS